MLQTLRSWLLKRLTIPEKVAGHAYSTGIAGQNPHEDAQHVVPYDENLLERSRTQWHFGDWESLARLERDTLQHHPDRAKLALLAAAGHLQQDNSQGARQFTRLAQDWGCSKKLISQILISGVHNSLGRAAAACELLHVSSQHFEAAINIGMPFSQGKMITEARSRNQIDQIEDQTLTNSISTSHYNQQQYTDHILIKEGYEACAYRVGNQVIKVYKSDYYQYNKEYNRNGEALFLKLNPSKFFIPILQATPFYIVMPFAGESVGDLYKLEPDKFNNKKFCMWLLELKKELARMKVKHRDINPSNILYNRETDDFLLIDFGWAIGPNELEKENLRPPSINIFGPTDDEAILKLFSTTSEHISNTDISTANTYYMEMVTKQVSDQQKYAYTRHVGSQSEVPSIQLQTDGSWMVEGYQSFRVTQQEIIASKSEHERKLSAMALYLPLLKELRFVDIGCSAGYFGLQALLRGVKHVSFVDHDPEYLEITQKVLNVLGLRNGSCIASKISEYNQACDVGIALALVHWIYSYSDSFGSLHAIISHLSKLAGHTLFIEWVDNADYAMTLAKHILQNPDRIRAPYNRELFLQALQENYKTVIFIAQITDTRQMYVATQMSADYINDNIGTVK